MLMLLRLGRLADPKDGAALIGNVGMMGCLLRAPRIAWLSRLVLPRAVRSRRIPLLSMVAGQVCTLLSQK